MKKLLFIPLLFIAINCFPTQFSVLRTNVRKAIGDPSTDTNKQRVGNTEINVALNLGQRVMGDAIGEWGVRKSTVITLVAGTTFYSLPTDFYVSDSVVYKNRSIPEDTVERLDRSESDWRVSNSTGTIVKYYINKERTKIGFEPVTDGTGHLEMWYIPVLADMSSDSAIPFNGLYKYYNYHHLLTYYAAGYLLLSDNKTASSTWFNLFTSEFGRMLDNIKVKPNYDPELLFERD